MILGFPVARPPHAERQLSGRTWYSKLWAQNIKEQNTSGIIR